MPTPKAKTFLGAYLRRRDGLIAFSDKLLRRLTITLNQHIHENTWILRPPIIFLSNSTGNDARLSQYMIKSIGTASLSDITHRDYVLAYLGSLKPHRFPYKLIIEALLHIISSGYDVALILALRGTSKHLKDLMMLLRLLEKYNLRHRVALLPRSLSEVEKVSLYKNVNCLIQLYLKMVPKDVVVPPLTILEAILSGVPVITTSSICLGELFSLYPKEFLVDIRELNSRVLANKLIMAMTSDNKVVRAISCRLMSKFSKQAIKIEILNTYKYLQEQLVYS